MAQNQSQLIKNILWVHVAGRTFAVDTQSGKKSRKKTGASSSGDKILSPMPGKITKILVTEGQEISAGQNVLVMEAMKMEYTLKADVSGSVEKISCAVGDQVVLGKQLVKFKV